MRKVTFKKNIHKSKVFVLIGALVFFFTIFLYKIYSIKVRDKLIYVAKFELKEFMERFLSTNIGYDILKKDDLDDILIVNKNKDGEILYIDYDLDKSYKLLDKVTNKISNLVNDLENGKNINDKKDILVGSKGIAIKVPMFISSNNILLSSLGPCIYVPVNFVGSILTNIKSEVKDYGINNSLVEFYITINITTDLISPVLKDTDNFTYKVLIASKVINGTVPNYYGGVIAKDSSAFKIVK